MSIAAIFNQSDIVTFNDYSIVDRKKYQRQVDSDFTIYGDYYIDKADYTDGGRQFAINAFLSEDEFERVKEIMIAITYSDEHFLATDEGIFYGVITNLQAGSPCIITFLAEGLYKDIEYPDVYTPPVPYLNFTLHFDFCTTTVATTDDANLTDDVDFTFATLAGEGATVPDYQALYSFNDPNDVRYLGVIHSATISINGQQTSLNQTQHARLITNNWATPLLQEEFQFAIPSYSNKEIDATTEINAMLGAGSFAVHDLQFALGTYYALGNNEDTKLDDCYINLECEYPTLMTSGVEYTGSVALGGQDNYYIQVSGHTSLQIDLYGLTNDADLYARWNGVIDHASIYDCESANGGTTAEQCVFNAGTIHDGIYAIAVYGYRASDYILKATLT